MPSSIDALKSTVTASGVAGLKVTSAYRPGSVTKSGNTSYHARMQAIDVAGSKDAMLRYAQYMQQKYGSVLLELIYQGASTSVQIWHGGAHKYNSGTLADHKDHVHVAATLEALKSVGGGNAVLVSNPSATPVGLVDGTSDIINRLRALSEIVTWLSSADNLKRVGWGIVGVALIGVGGVALASGHVEGNFKEAVKLIKAVK